MKRLVRVRLLGAVLGLLIVSVWTAESSASRAPKFLRWRDFGIIIEERSISSKLDEPVDRIEWVGRGRYRVHAGRCHVDVTLDYQPPPRGVFGSNKASIARVSGRRCR